MTIKRQLKEILADELEVNINCLNDEKTISTLAKDALIGTSTVDNRPSPKDGLLPSGINELLIFITLEQEFNVEIKDDEAINLITKKATISDLIRFVDEKIEQQ